MSEPEFPQEVEEAIQTHVRHARSHDMLSKRMDVWADLIATTMQSGYFGVISKSMESWPVDVQNAGIAIARYMSGAGNFARAEECGRKLMVRFMRESKNL